MRKIYKRLACIMVAVMILSIFPHTALSALGAVVSEILPPSQVYYSVYLFYGGRDIYPHYDAVTNVNQEDQSHVDATNATDSTTIFVTDNHIIFPSYREGNAKPVFNRITGGYGLMDKSKGTLIVEFGEYDFIGWDGCGLLRVERDGLWGFIDESGQEVIAPAYTELLTPFRQTFSNTSFQDVTRAFVRVGTNTLLIDEMGTVIEEWASNSFDTIEEFGYYLAWVSKDGKWGALDHGGSLTIPLEYDTMISRWFRRLVQKDGKWGIIDGYTGSLHIPLEYDDIRPADGHPNYASYVDYSVKRDGKWGCMDISGDILIPLEYDDAPLFTNKRWNDESNKYETFAWVKKNGKWGYINGEGEAVIPFEYDDVGSVSSVWNDAKQEPEIFTWVQKGDKWGYISPSNETIVPFEYDDAASYRGGHLYYNNNVVWLKKGAEWIFSYQTLLGDEYISNIPAGDFDAIFGWPDDQGLLLAGKNGKYGYIDSSGTVRIPMVYDDIGNFSLDGLAEFIKDGKRGLIDTKGETVVAPIYDSFGDYGAVFGGDNGKYAWAEKDGLWGILELQTEGPAVVQHTITYNANGGSGTIASGTASRGGNYTIAANVFTRPSYTFTGWNTQANGGGTAYAPGATISNVQSNITLYAQWSRNGGGSGGGGGDNTSGPTQPSTPDPAQPDNGVIKADKNGEAVLTVPQLNDIKNGKEAYELVYTSENGETIGTIAFSEDAAFSIANAATGGSVTVSLTIVASENLTGEQAETVGNRPVYDLSITDANNRQIPDFGKGGTVTVTLPYTLADVEDPNSIVVYYLLENGELEIMYGRYVPEKQAVVFVTNHFSLYFIGYNPVSFSDVSGHWAADYIGFVAARDLYAGNENGEFMPGGTMTRAMFCQVLANLESADLSAYKTSRFSDVPENAWYAAAVEHAADKGITAGIGNSRFSPDAGITREQMAVMLINYVKYNGYTLPDNSPVAAFADEDEISAWALEAVEAIQAAGIVTGKPGNIYDPKGTASRAEVAAVFARFIELMTT